jgi:transposase
VTTADLENASREELVERVLAEHSRAETEKRQRLEAERQMAWFRKQIFGEKSEKRSGAIIDVDQLSLGEALEVQRSAVDNKVTVKAHARQVTTRAESANDAPLRFDDSVPRTRRVILPPEVEGLNESEYEVISEKVTQRLVQTPAVYQLEEIVRPVVKLKASDKICSAPADVGVLEKSLADVSVLAGLLVDKCRFHLPLYRQHQRMAASGVHLARSTLTNWVHRSIDLLRPIYDAQLASILTSQVLAMDETPIKAGRKSKRKMKQGYYWPVFGDQQEVAFPFATSRAHRHAAEILGEYCGTFISDDYAAYAAYAKNHPQSTRATCWAHVRRKFVDAEDLESELCSKALEYIRGIYAIEKEIREQRLKDEAKLEARVERTRPIATEFFAWLKTELADAALLPTNPFTKAASHALKLKTELEVFLGDPAVPVDTNHLERALRPIAMGRKAWLFCWTEIGAEKIGIIQSLIATCVIHGIDPYTYLVDVLQRVAIQPHSEVGDLTPRLWKERFADQAIPSPALAG